MIVKRKRVQLKYMIGLHQYYNLLHGWPWGKEKEEKTSWWVEFCIMLTKIEFRDELAALIIHSPFYKQSLNINQKIALAASKSVAYHYSLHHFILLALVYHARGSVFLALCQNFRVDYPFFLCSSTGLILIPSIKLWALKRPSTLLTHNMAGSFSSFRFQLKFDLL